MVKNIFICVLIVGVTACVTDSPTEDPSLQKMMPDNTPYIAGLIEASYDTTHHYPEVVVGYMTDVNDSFHPDVLTSYPAIYNPTLLTQLVKSSYGFGFAFEAETEATVTVTGPLDTAKEQTVIFIHEGKGVYGDQNYELPREPEGRYRLDITLPDGREYTAQTIIPEAVDMSLADSINIHLRYEPFGDGTPREEFIQPTPIIFNTPADYFMTVLQYNTDKDRELLLMEPNESFAYTDRSNYLRTGIGYAVGFPKPFPPDTLLRRWTQNLDKPRDEILMDKHYWLRFSFFSKGIGRMFIPLVDFYSAGQKFQEEIVYPRLDALAAGDSTYLFDVSTINKIGKNGSVLPKTDSDAIGFFGGYFSMYRQTTLYPIRNFDLDSVLTVWNNQ